MPITVAAASLAFSQKALRHSRFFLSLGRLSVRRSGAVRALEARVNDLRRGETPLSRGVSFRGWIKLLRCGACFALP
jgi:hypothetical protein